MRQSSVARKTGSAGHGKAMGFAMMACCAVMVLPIAAFLVAGGSIGGLWANAGLFAPLLLCAGAHLVMHRMTGKSCHGDKAHNATAEATVRVASAGAEAPGTRPAP